MNEKEILRFCLERGLLLDKDVLNLFREIEDVEAVKMVLEKVKTETKQHIITKSVFANKSQVNELFLKLPEESQKKLMKLKINLGLSIEISKEISEAEEKNKQSKEEALIKKNIEEESGIKILSKISFPNKKLEVGDFIKYFRNRFSELKRILQEHSELDNPVSINKIFGNRQGISVIGLVVDKRVTKNKNIIFEIEDLTGKLKVLVNYNKPELYEKAEEVALDSVVGFKGSGNSEILFVNDIVFPETLLSEKKKSPFDENVVFIGDLHFGSKLFLEEGFLKFIDYVNGKASNKTDAEKIKYIFIIGDVVTGVGNYPNQERDLKTKDLEEQFTEVAELLSKIRKDISIIVSPGNHDGVRLMEPQPPLDEKYAWPLYNLKNLIFTTNPCLVNIGEKKGFEGFDVLTYHGFSFPFYANSVPKLVLKKAMNSPEEIMKYLLKNRHLAPTHASIQYFPSEDDALMVKKAPDIFVSGHTHKSGVSYYNNVLLVSVSSWEGKTPYQEKFGNIPDHCKVPMLNLKTREIKILDFE